MNLREIYERYKKEFNRTGWHPHPSKLLALRLLQIKDEMTIIDRNLFYESYKKIIIENIEEVIVDFAITFEDLVCDMVDFEDRVANLIKKSGQKQYEKYVRSVVFQRGYNVVRWGNEKYPNATSEEIYSVFCEFLKNDIRFPHTDIDISSFTLNELIDYLRKQGELKKDNITISLEGIYNKYREEFIETEKKPHPAELLMILMLQEKDKYIASTNSTSEFYSKNSELINEKAEDIMNDFDFTIYDLVEYLNEKNSFYFEKFDAEDRVRIVPEESLVFFNMTLINNKDRSVKKVYKSFIKSREESQSITPNNVRRRKPTKSIATTGFNF